MALGDYATALAMRDVLQGLVAQEIEKQRPRIQYAEVMSFNRTTRKCTVRFTGDTQNVTVNMGSIQPKTTGQIVRIDGVAGDRFVSDVMGEFYEPVETRVATAEGEINTLQADVIALESLTTTSAEDGSFMSASAGWTIAEQRARRWGKIVMVSFTVNRTGATIAAGTHGNVANVAIATLDAGWRPQLDEAGISPRSTGQIWAGYINSGGQLTLAALAPNGDLFSGNQLSGTATFISP